MGMDSKRGQGLSLNTIIIAIIVVVVLVIVILLTTGQLGIFAGVTGETVACQRDYGGSCVSPSVCNSMKAANPDIECDDQVGGCTGEQVCAYVPQGGTTPPPDVTP